MNKSDFFQFHQVKKRIWIWLNGTCERLKLDQFLNLPDNTFFNVEGSSNDYKTKGNFIEVC